ncbi:helix-turn-helix domain-containing protein [Sphaerisporangium rhizosphaerae]|uniref:Helix-turn-helix domain-containing protein n=1 Tax=Sphaerisporangium rhizosphaerae TaxID=2269375 RepID=A0ABW2P425_9ACTN
MAKLLLTVPEAVNALSISRAQLYRLMDSGAIPYLHIGRSRRIPLSALEIYIAELLAKETAA